MQFTNVSESEPITRAVRALLSTGRTNFPVEGLRQANVAYHPAVQEYTIGLTIDNGDGVVVLDEINVKAPEQVSPFSWDVSWYGPDQRAFTINTGPDEFKNRTHAAHYFELTTQVQGILEPAQALRAELKDFL